MYNLKDDFFSHYIYISSLFYTAQGGVHNIYFPTKKICEVDWSEKE